jgi:general secretion pathway protein J
MAQQVARRLGANSTASGFTLVELLVALMVMALLSLMSWRGLDAMGRAQTQTQARADTLMALSNGLAQWGADLDAMADDLPPAKSLNTTPARMEWNGQVLRITRYSNTADGAGLRVVAWALRADAEGKAWQRWQSPVAKTRADLQHYWTLAGTWAQSTTSADPARQVSQVRIVAATDWQIFYFRGDAWSNPGSSSEAAATIPDGVRLQLTLPPNYPLAGKITRDWIRPTAVGNKS